MSAKDKLHRVVKQYAEIACAHLASANKEIKMVCYLDDVSQAADEDLAIRILEELEKEGLIDAQGNVASASDPPVVLTSKGGDA